MKKRSNISCEDLETVVVEFLPTYVHIYVLYVLDIYNVESAKQLIIRFLNQRGFLLKKYNINTERNVIYRTNDT